MTYPSRRPLTQHTYHCIVKATDSIQSMHAVPARGSPPKGHGRHDVSEPRDQEMSNTALELLDVREAALRRRSIRRFDPHPIPRGELEEILEVVRRAPSAFNLQPWRFVVAESPEARARLAEAGRNQSQFRTAPVVIALYTDMAEALETVDEVLHPHMDEAKRASARAGILRAFAGRAEAEREGWGAEQGNIALGYLMLAAEAHGYQTSPMLGFDAAAVKEALGLPARVRIPALVAIGRGAEEGFPHHRHELERTVRWA